MFDHTIDFIKPDQHATRSETYSSEQVHGSMVSDWETRIRGREGLWIYAGVANSARDMTVCEVNSDHSPQQNVHH